MLVSGFALNMGLPSLLHLPSYLSFFDSFAEIAMSVGIGLCILGYFWKSKNILEGNSIPFSPQTVNQKVLNSIEELGDLDSTDMKYESSLAIRNKVSAPKVVQN